MREERIVLAACSEDESLPQSVELPADVFTACLTTPIKIALQWFVSRSVLKGESGISEDIIDKIPGIQNNRKTPLGELNWIFTAITDTIAWNVLPRPLFQQLFRQDLLLASLFRNFLLAERIMRAERLYSGFNSRVVYQRISIRSGSPGIWQLKTVYCKFPI